MEKNSRLRQLPVQSFWLLMAFFCVVFSSAFKRLTEYRFVEKANGHIAATRFICKKIKDGCRDKRHYLAAKAKIVKQHPARRIPHHTSGLGAVTYSFACSAAYSYAVWHVRGPGISVVSASPLYLLQRRLQV